MITPFGLPGVVRAQISSGPPTYEWNRWNTNWFTANLSLLAIADGVGYGQDTASIEQVGKQESDLVWRAERFLLGGQLKFDRPWNYVIGANYNSIEAEKPDRWSVLDFRLDIPVFDSARLRIGREKIGVSQEWIMPGNDMLFMERSTVDLAFAPQRNNGILLTDNFAGERGVWSVGAFNEWITTGNTFKEQGNQYTARVSYLPVDVDEGATLVQVAGALYYQEATKGQLQFRARPEINDASYFVDTGKFTADHSLLAQFEFTFIRGPLLIDSNLSLTSVSAPQAGDPLFHGWYVGASYALTGEYRRFNRRDGFYGALLPRAPLGQSGIGSWEVSARYTHTNLTDGTIEGGEISKWTAGVSWVPTNEWRVEFNYGYIIEDRSGLVGHTNGYSARVQWFPF